MYDTHSIIVINDKKVFFVIYKNQVKTHYTCSNLSIQ